MPVRLAARSALPSLAVRSPTSWPAAGNSTRRCASAGGKSCRSMSASARCENCWWVERTWRSISCRMAIRVIVARSICSYVSPWRMRDGCGCRRRGRSDSSWSSWGWSVLLAVPAPEWASRTPTPAPRRPDRQRSRRPNSPVTSRLLAGLALTFSACPDTLGRPSSPRSLDPHSARAWPCVPPSAPRRQGMLVWRWV